MHLASAWAARQHIVLGQETTYKIPNEIVAIPLPPEQIELTAALATNDAMWSQTEITEKATAHAANVFLALNGDRPALD